jgi:hypothetical protein
MELLLRLLAAFGVFLFLIVLRSLRREHIRVEHSVSWLVASLALVAVAFAVPLLGLTDTRGAADVVLFIIFAIALWIGYRSSRVTSELKDMNITLTQRIAILEFQLRELNEKAKTSS